MTGIIDVLIVDDEPPARERLERLVGELDGWRVGASCTSGREALEEVARRRPGVVLLDIRMPGMTGIETARHLSRLDAPPAVVFTTAYDQYALEAFESRAVGYLLKPVRLEHLRSALEHAARLAPVPGERLADAPEPLFQRRHVAARVRDELKLIPIEEVVYFRAEQKYVTVRHLEGEDLIDEPLRRLEEEFSDALVRANRSRLVGVAHIAALERGPGGAHQLRLRDGEVLPVSRRQVGELKRRLRAASRRAGM